jgi:hypothetical protein
MADEYVDGNLKGRNDLDLTGWNGADWNGAFADHHTDGVLVDWKGQKPTRGIQTAHRRHEGVCRVDRQFHATSDQRSIRSSSGWGSGHASSGSSKGAAGWVTVARWRDGAIAEEYIWPLARRACGSASLGATWRSD